MKVTIPEIPDSELAGILRQSGLTEQQVKRYFAASTQENGNTERIRLLRLARRSLLDTIHKEQTVLDQLDNLLWCTENKNN